MSIEPIYLPHEQTRQHRAPQYRREVRSQVVTTQTPLAQWNFVGGNGWNTGPVSPWEAEQAVRLAYYQNIYVWACAQAIAEDIASLTFRAGPDPSDLEDFNEAAPLADLLGPPTPKSPGGPAPNVSSKTWWEWTIKQLLITGRFSSEIVGFGTSQPQLWPIPSQNLTPIPSKKPGEWWSGFRYGGWGQTGQNLRPEDVFFHWRPSADDFRRPESVLQAARLDVSVAVMQDRYDYAFLVNDARPAAVIVHERFAVEGETEQFRTKFLTDHQGPDNAGRPIFVSADPDGAKPQDAISITPLGLSQRDAEFIQRHEQKIRSVIVAFGVPMTRLGDTSGRTFSNAGQEYFNYYTKLKTICNELRDVVNMSIAPRLGKEYGFFDTTPLDDAIESAKIQAAGLTDLVKTRLIQINEARAELGLKAADDGDRFLTDEELGLLQGAANTLLVQQAAPPPTTQDAAAGGTEELPSAVAPSAEPDQPQPEPATRFQQHTETRDAAARKEHRTKAYHKTSRRVKGHEEAMQAAMQDILDRQLAAALSRLDGKRGRQALREQRDASSDVFDTTFWTAETTKKMKPIFESIFRDASNSLLEELNQDSTIFDVNDPIAQDLITTRTNMLAGNVTETTYNAIKQALADGAAEGESVPKLADRIRHLFEQTYKNRAETVARTEVISAYNGSAYATGSALPEDVVAGFEWLATPGPRTRASHAAADGQVIAQGDKFHVGGTHLAYPGDPSGPAGLIVNCRCTLLTLSPQEYADKSGNTEVITGIVQRGAHRFFTHALALDALLSRSTNNPAPEDGWLPSNTTRAQLPEQRHYLISQDETGWHVTTRPTATEVRLTLRSPANLSTFSGSTQEIITTARERGHDAIVSDDGTELLVLDEDSVDVL